MTIPLYSTFALCTEIIMAIIILTIFYNGYRYKKFNYILVTIALSYEILFNISYMVYRSFVKSGSTGINTPFEISLAIVHGILSLIMFILLIVFLILAWKNYKKNINYFKKHKTTTILFIIFWLISAISGIIIYAIAYLF